MVITATSLQASELTTRDAFPAPNTAEEVERLGFAVQVPEPALFVVWQQTADHVGDFIDACLRAGAREVRSIHVQGNNPEGIGLDDLRSDLLRSTEGTVIVLLGCLSGVAPARRMAFNAGRSFWLNLGRLVLFVEPIDCEAELKKAFPDIFSLVRDEVKLYPPQTEGQLRMGEVESVDENGAVCWVEIAPGERVKVRFSLDLLKHLHPHPGLELVWAPAGKELRPEQFRPRTFEPLPSKDREELNRLNRAFRDRVARGELLKDDEG